MWYTLLMKRREFLKALGVVPAVPLVVSLSERKPLHSGLVHLKTECFRYYGFTRQGQPQIVPLVKDQTDGSENGIYVVSTGTW